MSARCVTNGIVAPDPDALQIATALAAGCEIFVTNDRALRRATELRVVTLDDLAPLTE
jgi:hypothetical protein